MPAWPVVNTHVHIAPNYSAFSDVGDALAAAAAEGAAAVGISNFFDQSVYPRFGQAAEQAGITPLYGLEFITLVDELATAGIRVNDPANPGRMYLCGKGIDPDCELSERAAATARAIRQGNDTRMAEMTEKLSAHLVASGLAEGFTAADVAARVAEAGGVPVEWVSLQERHLAQAAADAVLSQGAEQATAILTAAYGQPPKADLTNPTAVQAEVRSRLLKVGTPAFAPEAPLAMTDAYLHVLDRGGIPTYPTLADGVQPVCEYEADPAELANKLLDLGIHAAELIPIRNASAEVDRYVQAFTDAGLIVVAGTEHNTPDRIPIAPACVDGPLSDTALAAFWEGTCIVAAHQARIKAGRPGYVDADGAPTGLRAELFAEGERIIAPDWVAERDALIGAIAPAIRGLAGFPHVRFTADQGANGVQIATPADALAALKDQVNRETQQVAVTGLGTFTMTRPDASGRLAGRIAVVTGGAQGFGLGIATDLLAEGATVVLADMNLTLATSQAATLAEQHGPERAWAVAVNVSDEASVQAMVRTIVARVGGIDLFVSNAGVLRAESVFTQPAADFDLVTAVNYRGYFLCTKHVAPVMRAQYEASGRWSDIVEINSKSGLEGSKANFAYAGSKFGGIGLTQSFALELVAHGIKVNAVCPGNFLDGPLWSDPERGLFVQYLRAGKVPGATTIDEVRAFYEAKVPMRRGCTPTDVARAVLYVVEQAYETGQAIPVTGGQNMLH